MMMMVTVRKWKENRGVAIGVFVSSSPEERKFWCLSPVYVPPPFLNCTYGLSC